MAPLQLRATGSFSRVHPVSPGRRRFTPFDRSHPGQSLRRSTKLARALDEGLHVIRDQNLDLLPHKVQGSYNRLDNPRKDIVDFRAFKFSGDKKRVVGRQLLLAGSLLEIAQEFGERLHFAVLRQARSEESLSTAKLQKLSVLPFFHAHREPKPTEVLVVRESVRKTKVECSRA